MQSSIRLCVLSEQKSHIAATNTFASNIRPILSLNTVIWFPPKMGPGPFYLFYRPYHLGHIEAMACVADAALRGEAVIQPIAGFQTNVYAYAKKNLQQGTTLDGVGGHACYGLIENCVDQGQHAGLPICLAKGVVLERDVPQDDKILLSDVTFDPHRPDFALHTRAKKVASASPA